ncbi:MAG: hypothetical protein JJW00_06745 [Sulfurimonas sp.]|nr:hypothetical protein [Sulfurimonas sp.]
MLKSLNIVYRLFKHSFLLTGVLYLMALLVFIGVLALKDSYKTSLQNEFATKQPHIKIGYIDNNMNMTQEQIDDEMRSIRSLSHNIDAISPYVSGDMFFDSTGFKEGGNAQYSGNIRVIGMGQKSFVYDFFDSSFVDRKPFEIKYTPLEFVYAFRTLPNLVVFNNALFNSYFPVIQSAETFIYENDTHKYSAKLASVFNDYDKQAIIYTTISFANKLLKQNPNKIDGFFVNSKNLNDIDVLTMKLKNSLSKEKFIVSSWLEQREQQFMMFFLFESLSVLIVSVILFLSILFILLLLYNSIVKKSYQLSVLYTIGFSLKKEIFLFLLFVVSAVTSIAVVLLYSFIPKITGDLNLPYDINMFNIYINYMGIMGVLFMLIAYILIDSSYKMKARSVF